MWSEKRVKYQWVKSHWLRNAILKKLMISILIVNFISLLVFSKICMAEPIKQSEFIWVNKKSFSIDLKEYDLSLIPTDALMKIHNDFKSTPYIIKLDSHGIRNEFDEIVIERAWVSDDSNRIYLLCSIRFVSDLYIVYELKNFEIDSKYTTSGWNLK